MDTLQPIADVPADFGPLITTRKRPVLDRIVLVCLMLFFGGLGVGGVVGAGVTLIQKPAAGVLLMLIVMGISLAVCYGCYRGTREIFRAVDFYQGGAVSRCFSKKSQYSYKDAVSLEYGLTRQYFHGIYAGTALSMRLRMTDKRTLRLDVKHKERPKGLAITIFGKKFEGEDEMDVVRDVIASHIANYLTTQLAEKGEVDWAGARLTPEGVTPRSGPSKDQFVAWGDISGSTTKAGFMYLFRSTSERSFVRLACAARNFYPGLQVSAELAASAATPLARAAA